MRDALLILRKDLDHLRWPLCAFLCLIAARMAIDVLLPRHGELAPAQRILGMVFLLAAIGLIYESVRQERTTGDQQYWLTRPFRWHSILAAKALFLGLLVLLPVILADTVALAANGVSPLPSLSPIVDLLLIGAFVTSAASLTRTTVQFILILVSCVLLFALSTTLVAHLFREEAVSWGSAQAVRGIIDGFIGFGAIAAVIWLQYSHRAAGVSRGLFAAGMLASLIGIPGWHAAFALLEKFQGPGPGSSVQIAFDLTRPPEVSPGSWSNLTGDDVVGVRIPLAVTGIREATALKTQRVRTMIGVPGGPQWDSGWRIAGGIIGKTRFAADPREISGESTYWLEVNVDRAFYEGAGLKDTPVQVKSTAAFTSLSTPSVFRVPVPATAYRTRPGELCSVSIYSGERLGITCVSASSEGSDASYWVTDGQQREEVAIGSSGGDFSAWLVASTRASSLQLVAPRFDRFLQPDLTRMPSAVLVETRRRAGYFERSAAADGIRLGMYEAGRSGGRRPAW